MATSAAGRAILEILESLPTHPTSGEILGAITRAERAGFERGLLCAVELEALPHNIDTPALLRRQAD